MPIMTGWEKVNVSHLDKLELFAHLKALGKIPPEIKSPGQRSFKSAPWFYKVYKQGFYWEKSAKCIDEDLPEAVKADMWFFAAEIKARYLTLPLGNGRRGIRVDIEGMPDALLLYLLKELEIIPQNVVSPYARKTPNNVRLKWWGIRKKGYFIYGWEKREIVIDVQKFVDHIDYVGRIIRRALNRYNICDYHEAYSQLYFKAYELSGYRLFLDRKWFFTVMRYAARQAYKKEQRHYRRFVSYEEIVENTIGGEDRFLAKLQEVHYNYKLTGMT